MPSSTLKLLLTLITISIQFNFIKTQASCSESADCKDPFGSICVDNLCQCKSGFPLQVANVCLPLTNQLNGFCWVTGQCELLGQAICQRKTAGRKRLEMLTENLWTAYADSGANEKFIPGKCICPEPWSRVVERSSGQGQHCIPRYLGRDCKTSYECSSRVKFSWCEKRKCACFANHTYDRESDECNREVIGQQRLSCEDSDSKWCPLELAFETTLQDNFANLIGFSLSMSMIGFTWFVCRKCSHLFDDDGDQEFSSLEEDPDKYEEIDLDQMPSYQDILLEEEDNGHDDDVLFDPNEGLPSYDEAVSHINLKKKINPQNIDNI